MKGTDNANKYDQRMLQYGIPVHGGNQYDEERRWFCRHFARNIKKAANHTLRLRYDDGREETRVIDANEIDSSNCNIIDLHLKMYHLNDEGRIDQRSLMMNLTTAHLYMNYRILDATVNKAADFISWYEQQLALERKYSLSSNNRGQLEQLLMYLSAS